MYREAQYKPYYLLLLSMFKKTCKYDNVRVAPRTLVKAVLEVPSTSCNNERQSFTKLSYTAIDNILTNLLPAGLQDFFQVLNILNATTTLNKLLGVLPRWNSLLGLSLGYSAATFLVPQILAHEDALVNGCVFIFTCITSTMTSHRILITAQYKKCTFIFCLLICLCATGVKFVILCKFS